MPSGSTVLSRTVRQYSVEVARRRATTLRTARNGDEEALKRALTAKTVEHLAPTDRRVEIRDTRLPGFGLRVSPSGQKTFFLCARIGTRQRRISLGVYPRTSLAEAREKALGALRSLDAGNDPAIVPDRAQKRVEDAVSDFIERYAKPKTRTWRITRMLLERELVARHRGRLIASLTRHDVLAIIDDAVARGVTLQANRILAAMRRFFNWCVERGLVEASPAQGIKPPTKERSRERVLSDDEVGNLARACHRAGYPFGHLFLALLLTGQRRGEVTGMRWSEIDFDQRVWRLPGERTKNGCAHSVPLADSMMALLADVPRFVGSDFVFTTTGCTPVSGWGKPKDRVGADAGLIDWRVHDLRRTAASGMARLGVAPHVVEKVLNHISGTISGVAAVYNRYGYDEEKREALHLWSIHAMNLSHPENRTASLSSAWPSRFSESNFMV